MARAAQIAQVIIWAVILVLGVLAYWRYLELAHRGLAKTLRTQADRFLAATVDRAYYGVMALSSQSGFSTRLRFRSTFEIAAHCRLLRSRI
jgi:hypothetical protein